MTTRTEAASTPTAPCDCGSCSPGDLPVNPFAALRVAYGMLLGEDDFKTLMGNPRGKHMLHQAWQHGSGVVWGYRVEREGTRTLRVSPGLAVDRLGRELRTEETLVLNVQKWLDHEDEQGRYERSGARTMKACVVVTFDCCPTDPVPTLSDPCDITRKHDDYSRVLERARVVLVPGPCPHDRRPYHRVRVLLGLDPVGDDDAPGEQAREARDQVLSCPAERRPGELLSQFRRMAAHDVADLEPAPEPAREPGKTRATQFPALEKDSGVVLAHVDVTVKETAGQVYIDDVEPDCTCRTALIPTTTIQELLCGLSSVTFGELSAEAETDAGGPRVRADARMSTDGRLLTFQVTRRLVAGSVTRRAVHLTSLSERGWVEEDIYTVRYDPEHLRVEVQLADRPVNDLVRLVVRGTGSTPIVGEDPTVPLAGLDGGPPGTAHDGHDAVLMFRNPLSSGAQS
jgi:hypothetical protein